MPPRERMKGKASSPPVVDSVPRHGAESTTRDDGSPSRFVARALAARDEARNTGEYFTADEVLRELDALHARARGCLRK